jgi:hypothetical protein
MVSLLPARNSYFLLLGWGLKLEFNMGDSSLCILLALVPRADSKKNYCHN